MERVISLGRVLKVIIVVLLVDILMPGNDYLRPVLAQDSGAPLLLFQEGDLWMWSEASPVLTSLTRDAHIYYADSIALSPDGSQAAALVLSPVTLDAVARVGGFSGTWPTDVAIIDLQSGALRVIAVQPDDARLFADDGQPDNVILRSTPAWSPDGTQVAWTEIHYPSFVPERSRLLIHDLLSGALREVVRNLPEPAGAGPSPLDVRWSAAGIAILQPAFDVETSTFPMHFMVVSPEGALLTEATIPDDDAHRYAGYGWLWTGPDALALGVNYADGRWETITAGTGALVPVAGQVEQVSALAVETSLATRYTVDVGAQSYFEAFDWQVRDPLNDQEWTFEYHSYTAPVIAPDGRALAYLDSDGMLVIWRDGQARLTGLVRSPYDTLWWGPVQWQMTGSAAPTVPAETIACPGALPPRLTVGGQARVVPETTPNNVRSAPATSASTVTGQIPPGAAFTVLDGPVCADGYAWWQVDYSGLVGWTVEGDASAYWLEPR